MGIYWRKRKQSAPIAGNLEHGREQLDPGLVTTDHLCRFRHYGEIAWSVPLSGQIHSVQGKFPNGRMALPSRRQFVLLAVSAPRLKEPSIS